MDTEFMNVEKENSIGSGTSLSENSTTEISDIKTLNLNEEASALIAKIISETDEAKTRDLTQLFNVNQNKKTVVRINKLSDLLDAITDQALTRFTKRPDEISNKELFDGLKIVQDLIERGQKQVSGVSEMPLIQVNQQTNEVNLGSPSSLNRESRERVKSAVLNLLDNVMTKVSSVEETFVEAESVENKIINDSEEDS